MAKFKDAEAALQAIDDDAATRAWQYLERETPNTAKAVQYLIMIERWSADDVMARFTKTYGITEEKTTHKIKLVVEALEKERDVNS